jgi:hypothetical protein
MHPHLPLPTATTAAAALLLLGVAAPAAHALRSFVDENGTVHECTTGADGSSTCAAVFPLVLYAENHVYTWEPASVLHPLPSTTPRQLMKRLAAAGFTGVLNYGFGEQVPQITHPTPSMNWSRVVTYLDGLHAAGLRSMYMLNLFATHDGKDIRLPWWNTSTSKEAMTEFVRHIKDHPAILGYDLWEGNEGVTGLSNLTRHTDLVRALDPHHLTLRNEGPIDMLTYQNHDSCKVSRPLGFRDMCYAIYRFSKPAWHNSSDAWGSQMYPYPVSPEVTNQTQGMWSTGLNTQVMNLSGSLCTFPQDQFCREVHPHSVVPPGGVRERCTVSVL